MDDLTLPRRNGGCQTVRWGAVDPSVKYAVGQHGIADLLVPAPDRQL
jgi:hypothetical protein